MYFLYLLHLLMMPTIHCPHLQLQFITLPLPLLPHLLLFYMQLHPLLLLILDLEDVVLVILPSPTNENLVLGRSRFSF